MGQDSGAKPRPTGTRSALSADEVRAFTDRAPRCKVAVAVMCAPTQAGDQVSPPFAWSNVPEGIVSFVLIARDVDAASGNGTADILHWMLWNFPAASRSL